MMHIAHQLLLKAQLDLDEALYDKISKRLDEIEKPLWEQIESTIITGLMLENARTVAVYIKYVRHYEYHLDIYYFLQHDDVEIRSAVLKYCIFKNANLNSFNILLKECSLYNQMDVALILLNNNADPLVIFSDIDEMPSLFLHYVEIMNIESFWDESFYFKKLSECCFHEDSFIKRFSCQLLSRLCENRDSKVFDMVAHNIMKPIQYLNDFESYMLVVYALFQCNVEKVHKLDLIKNWPTPRIYSLVGRLEPTLPIIKKVITLNQVEICKEIMPIFQYFPKDCQVSAILKCLNFYGFDSIVYINLDLICDDAKSKVTEYAAYLLSGDVQDISLGLALFSCIPIQRNQFKMLLKFTNPPYLLNVRSAAYACIALFMRKDQDHLNLDLVDLFIDGLNDETDVRLTCAQSLCYIAKTFNHTLSNILIYDLCYKEDSDKVVYYLSQCVNEMDIKLLNLLKSFHDYHINDLWGIEDELDQVDWLLSIENVIHQDCY